MILPKDLMLDNMVHLAAIVIMLLAGYWCLAGFIMGAKPWICNRCGHRNGVLIPKCQVCKAEKKI